MPSLSDIYQFISQNWFSGKPIWQTTDIPDLTGKVIIVTGGNSGIGKATVKALLEHNAVVYIAARNHEKVEAAIEELKAETGKEALFMKVDLGDLSSIKLGVEGFIKRESRLDVLFNNAGIMMPPIDEITPNGTDITLATNVLGAFYITKLLLPLMIRTAETTGVPSRVVNTSSGAHYTANINFGAFKDGPVRRKMGAIDLYGQATWAKIVLSNEIAKRYGDKGIVSSSLNPGNLNDTKLSAHITGGFLYYLLRSTQIYPTAWGVLAPLWAGTSPEGVDFNGKFIVPWGRLGSARADTNDPQLGKELWTWLEEQVEQI